MSGNLKKEDERFNDTLKRMLKTPPDPKSPNGKRETQTPKSGKTRYSNQKGEAR